TWLQSQTNLWDGFVDASAAIYQQQGQFTNAIYFDGGGVHQRGATFLEWCPTNLAPVIRQVIQKYQGIPATNTATTSTLFHFFSYATNNAWIISSNWVATANTAGSNIADLY